MQSSEEVSNPSYHSVCAVPVSCRHVSDRVDPLIPEERWFHYPWRLCLRILADALMLSTESVKTATKSDDITLGRSLDAYGQRQPGTLQPVQSQT